MRADVDVSGAGEAPLVGRAVEMARLESLWSEVVQTGGMQTVVLRGPGGVGKKRLIEALNATIGEGTEDEPAPRVLQAGHGPSPDPGQGIAQLVASSVEIAGYDSLQNFSEARGYDPEMRAALVELVRPLHRESDGVRMIFSEPEERFAAATRWLEREARRRPMLVVLEEVQWGRTTLDWLQFALSCRLADALPVMVLVTASEELLATRPVESVQWTELLDHRRTEAIDVDALSDAAMRKVVRAMASLDAQVEERIVERSRGNPSFAVELIRDWRQRGMLRKRDDGTVTLEASADVAMPDSLYDAWRRGLRSHFEDFGPRREDALVCLELAAVLGGPIRHDEWREACRRRGLDMPDLLARTALAGGLIEELEGGEVFRVSHALIRETLLRRARESGRAADHHRVCAQVAADSALLDSTEAARRSAHHWMEAGDWEAAAEPLRDAIRAAAAAQDFTVWERLLERLETAIEQMQRSCEDPLRLWAQVHRGWLELASGSLERAAGLAESLVERVEPDADQHSAVEAHRLGSAVALEKGEPERSLAEAQRALEVADQSDDPALIGRAYDRRGRVRRYLGETEAAGRDFRAALERFEQTDRDDWIGGAHLAIASAERQCTRYRRAGDHLRTARAIFKAAGYRQALGETYNAQGELARHRERWDEAIQCYMRAIRIKRNFGLTQPMVARLNLGFALIGAGEFVEAGRQLCEVFQVIRDSESRRWEAYVDVGLLCCALAQQNHKWARRLLGRVLEGLEAFQIQAYDFGSLLETAGTLAERAGERRLAESCWTLSASQWQALNRPARLEAVLNRLGGRDD